jgi:hypothetical protein
MHNYMLNLNSKTAKRSDSCNPTGRVSEDREIQNRKMKRKQNSVFSTSE